MSFTNVPTAHQAQTSATALHQSEVKTAPPAAGTGKVPPHTLAPSTQGLSSAGQDSSRGSLPKHSQINTAAKKAVPAAATAPQVEAASGATGAVIRAAAAADAKDSDKAAAAVAVAAAGMFQTVSSGCTHHPALHSSSLTPQATTQPPPANAIEPLPVTTMDDSPRLQRITLHTAIIRVMNRLSCPLAFQTAVRRRVHGMSADAVCDFMDVTYEYLCGYVLRDDAAAMQVVMDELAQGRS